MPTATLTPGPLRRTGSGVVAGGFRLPALGPDMPQIGEPPNLANVQSTISLTSRRMLER